MPFNRISSRGMGLIIAKTSTAWPTSHTTKPTAVPIAKVNAVEIPPIVSVLNQPATYATGEIREGDATAGEEPATSDASCHTTGNTAKSRAALFTTRTSIASNGFFNSGMADPIVSLSRTKVTRMPIGIQKTGEQ